MSITTPLRLYINGTDSRDHGVYCLQVPHFIRPKKRYDAIKVPGRSGALMVWRGDYDMVELSVKVGIESDNIDAARNWIGTAQNVRLTPDLSHVYECVQSSEQRWYKINNRMWVGEMTFLCQPLRRALTEQIHTGNPVTLMNTGNVLARPRIMFEASDTTVELMVKRMDGRNLLLGSDAQKSASSPSWPSVIGYYTMSEDMETRQYTLTIKGELGEGRTTYIAYINTFAGNGGAMIANPIPRVGDAGVFRATFTGKINGSAEPNRIMIIHYPHGLTSESTIEWIKLEHGVIATPHSLAPEDDADLLAAETWTLQAPTGWTTLDGLSGILTDEDGSAWGKLDRPDLPVVEPGATVTISAIGVSQLSVKMQERWV